MLSEVGVVLFSIEREVKRLLHLSSDEGVDPNLCSSLVAKLRELRKALSVSH